MSIVEKAMNRGRPDKPRPLSPLPAPSPAMEAAKPLAADGPQVAVRHLLAIEENPGLARDFRFLKRPVLARVFGLSRSAQKAGNLVMITSDLPQAGKTFISLNLAASMGQEQMISVLLIDGDPVRRALTQKVGAVDRPGLMELLGTDTPDPASVVLPTDVPSLRFLPAGQPRADATELLAGPRMLELLRRWSDPNLVVLLDSPPLLITSEARVLAEHVNHALVVVESGRSSSADVTQMLDILKGSPASVSLILNKTPAAGASRNSDYYSY